MNSKPFSIKARTKATVIGALVVVMIAAVAVSFPSQAQVDPGFHEIFQLDDFGRMVKKGEIFVAQREPGATNYVEHWVLFDNYVYPNAENRVATTIKPSRLNYQNKEDFFARVAWGPGFRYVRVDCLDTDKLPGR